MSFIYDCHVHTSEVSFCGQIPGAEMADLYQRANYTGIVITDHYYDGFFASVGGSWENQVDAYLEGYEKAYKQGRKIDLEVLLGLELRFAGTSEDFLVYGVDRNFLLAHPRLDQYELSSFYQLAQKHRLLVVQAHPYRHGLDVASPEFLDGIEVFNGNPRHNSNNDQALNYALRHDLIQIACSDAHRYEDVARAGIELPTKIKTSAELVVALRGNPIKKLVGQREKGN